jgi:hypothetical protein
LEEKITIGESSSHPRKPTGETGDRCGEACEDRETRAEDLLEPKHLGKT